VNRLIFLLAALALLGGCISRDKTEAEAVAETNAASARIDAAQTAKEAQLAKDRQVAQVASNLGPIAEVVSDKGQPAMGKVIDAQRDTLVVALDIKAKDMPVPAVSREQLLRDAEAALADYRSKNADLQARADQAAAAAAKAEAARAAAEAVATAEKEKADSEARTAWWLKVGAGAASLLGVAATLAARLGLPGGGLVASVVDLVTPMLKKRTNVAESAVAAADVGRQGLALVESLLAQKHPEVAQKITDVVSAATGGRADGLEGLFKTCAKAYTLDHDGQHAEAIDSLLTQLRGEKIATSGGLATALQGVIKQS
jgi:colicin import membrane protein